MAAGLLVGALANPALINAIIGLVTKGVERAAQSPNVALQPTDAAAVTNTVVHEVVQGIHADPVLRNELNQERWYQSRVTLGAIAALISTILGFAGIAISDDEMGMIIDVIGALGTIASIGYLLYGRWAGNLKPVGHV